MLSFKRKQMETHNLKYKIDTYMLAATEGVLSNNALNARQVNISGGMSHSGQESV